MTNIWAAQDLTNLFQFELLHNDLHLKVLPMLPSIYRSHQLPNSASSMSVTLQKMICLQQCFGLCDPLTLLTLTLLTLQK